MHMHSEVRLYLFKSDSIQLIEIDSRAFEFNPSKKLKIKVALSNQVKWSNKLLKSAFYIIMNDKLTLFNYYRMFPDH